MKEKGINHHPRSNRGKQPIIAGTNGPNSRSRGAQGDGRRKGEEPKMGEKEKNVVSHIRKHGKGEGESLTPGKSFYALLVLVADAAEILPPRNIV